MREKTEPKQASGFGLLAVNFNGDFNTLAALAESLNITAVPEPATAWVLGTLVLTVIRPRRRSSHGQMPHADPKWDF